jgi:hypothetical protein
MAGPEFMRSINAHPGGRHKAAPTGDEFNSQVQRRVICMEDKSREMGIVVDWEMEIA